MIFQSIQTCFRYRLAPPRSVCRKHKKLDVPIEGALIAHNETYGEKGSNVNFVCVDSEDHITVRTFEGVEDETLSCGTGVIAALASFSTDKINLNQIQVQTLGGFFTVCFKSKS